MCSTKEKVIPVLHSYWVAGGFPGPGAGGAGAGVHCDRQGRQDLQDLQEVLGSETVGVLQTDRQEGLGCREVWVHVEESHLGPKVGVDKVVEDQSRRRRLRRRHWGLRQAVRDWVVGVPLREEVHS